MPTPPPTPDHTLAARRRCANAPLALALCLAALLAAAPRAHAADEPDDRRARIRAFIERFDTNGDGRLNADERAAARELLQKARQLQGQQPAEPDVPATIDPDTTKLYKPRPGPHTLMVVDTHTLRDDKRNKDLHLRLTFPNDGGPYPVIVFSHGAMGSKDGADPLANHWASHGYVVIRATHGDSLSLMSTEEKLNIRSIQQHLNSKTINDQWDDRPKDVSLILDSFKQLEADVPGLKGRIDHDRVGMSGHSYGAHTTQMVAGMALTNPLTKQTTTLRDDRPKCFVAISPQGTSATITNSAWKDIDRPMLMITGSKDGSPRDNKPPATRLEAWQNLPAQPGDKFLLFINDAHHGFGGINGNTRFPSSGPNNPDHVLLVNTTALAMFDAYLKDDPAAKAYLRSDTVKTETKGQAYVEHKTAK